LFGLSPFFRPGPALSRSFGQNPISPPLMRPLDGNRALPDDERDGFVDALARRIATFDGRSIAAAKRLVNQVSLPSADNLLSALNSFQTALTWPETLQRVSEMEALMSSPMFRRVARLSTPDDENSAG
jgi:hypothetical protein